MQRVEGLGYSIVMTVHDEIVVEIPKDDSDDDLTVICNLMGDTSEVYAGVPFPADGYLTPYYKKD